MRDEEIRDLVAFACRMGDVPELLGRIRVAWGARFTARMGDARWDAVRKAGLIRLSAPLWPKASEAERRETVIHEACHVIADFKFGRNQGHGDGWRHMMMLCGYPDAKRCHAVDREAIVRRRQQSRVKARCACPDGVSVGPTQARRIRAGVAYHCRHCRQRVEL